MRTLKGISRAKTASIIFKIFSRSLYVGIITSERGTVKSVSRFGKSVAMSKDSGANVCHKSDVVVAKVVKVSVFKTLLNKTFRDFNFS